MIRLPHGTDRVGDELALALFAWAGRQQAPHAAPEIGAAEQGVRVERDENDAGEPVGEAHVLRRICRYRSQHTITPRKQYSSVNVMNGTTRPGIGVTASRVRKTPWITHGCRPSSVTIHPASTAMNPSGVASATARLNQRWCARTRRRPP